MKKQNFNILLLGGGKRVGLARCFKDAARTYKLMPNIYSYEITENEPIKIEAKIIKGLKWDDQNIKKDLIYYINKLNINLLISNVDPALLLHSEISELHTSCRYVTEKKIVENCHFKNKFQDLCIKNNLNIIPEWDRKIFPMFIKPINGSSSNGAEKIYSKEHLKSIVKDNEEDFILQQYIHGIEYTVDAYVDQKNIICAISPRERIKTAGGEVIVTKTIQDQDIKNFSEKVIKILNLKGPLSIQFIRDMKTNRLWLMEVNPRLAGGVLASIEAGFNICEMMIKESLGYQATKITQGRTITMRRYFCEVFSEGSY